MQKNILFILFILFSSSLQALPINETKNDIYFGNGVWNDKEDAELSRLYLEIIVQKEILNYNPKLLRKYGKVKLQYNWGEGHMDDVLETYYQLKEAGQVSHYDFFRVVSLLTRNAGLSAVATAALMAKMPFTAKAEQSNVDEMLEKYYNESFKNSHRVLLVSHSQGNLFANRIYDAITPTGYQSYFANLQVASPADKINAQKGNYVTLKNDTIINPVPESMTGNANGKSGHSFVSAYLEQDNPREKIINNLKTLLSALDSTASQWAASLTWGDKGTKDYRITVEHRFDANAVLNDEVYPFALSKYLYQVPDNDGMLHYVKASFGGTKILDAWDNQKEEQFYKLEGTNPIEYIEANQTQQTFKLLKTGQTKCYDYDTGDEKICTEVHKGQDGYYKIGLDRSYTRDNIKEIVIDNATGLIWQDSEEAKILLKTWEEAKTHCENFTFGEYTDWRLPTIKELQTLPDFSKYGISLVPSIDDVFQNIIPFEYWSSTTYAKVVGRAWYVQFGGGSFSTTYNSDTLHVRCVRN